MRELAFEVQREADGKKYPLPVKELFRLAADGTLTYGAYFGNMPMELNHNDSVTWASGAAGAKVLEVVKALLADPARRAQLKQLGDRDERPYPDAAGVYRLWLSQGNADSTWIIPDAKSQARATLDAAFGALLAEFEKATGRPKKPEELPQAR